MTVSALLIVHRPKEKISLQRRPTLPAVTWRRVCDRVPADRRLRIGEADTVRRHDRRGDADAAPILQHLWYDRVPCSGDHLQERSRQGRGSVGHRGERKHHLHHVMYNHFVSCGLALKYCSVLRTIFVLGLPGSGTATDPRLETEKARRSFTYY